MSGKINDTPVWIYIPGDVYPSSDETIMHQSVVRPGTSYRINHAFDIDEDKKAALLFNPEKSTVIPFFYIDKDGVKHDGVTNEQVIHVLRDRASQQNKSENWEDYLPYMAHLQCALDYLKQREKNKRK